MNSVMKFVCLLFFITNFYYVHSEYLSYYTQYYCEQHPDRRILISDDGEYSSLILHSSHGRTKPNQKCKVKIVGQHNTGFIVTAQQISLNSSQCEDYIEFDKKIKWCDGKSAKSVTTDSNELDIVFKTGNSSTSSFQLIITSFTDIWNKKCQNANEIRCQGGKHECIYNGFECDGYSNCPFSSDERDCPSITTMLDDSDNDLQNLTANEVINEKSEPIHRISVNNTESNATQMNSTRQGSTTTFLSPSTTARNEYNSTIGVSIAKSTIRPNEHRTSVRATIKDSTNSSSHEHLIKPKKVAYETSSIESGGKGNALLLIFSVFILLAFTLAIVIHIYSKNAKNLEILYTPL